MSLRVLDVIKCAFERVARATWPTEAHKRELSEIGIHGIEITFFTSDPKLTCQGPIMSWDVSQQGSGKWVSWMLFHKVF